jgi:hypothetical protein
MRPLDGGFESGGAATPWVLTGSASFALSPSPVHTGIYSMGLTGSRAFGGGIQVSSRVSQVIPTTPGEQIVMSHWLFPDAGAVALNKGLNLFADVNPGDGSNLVEYDFVRPSFLGGGSVWSPWISPPFTAEGSQAFVMWLDGVPTVDASTTWFVDDLQVAGDDDVAKRSRWLAHQRLVTVLKGINGPGGGYHVDLGQRVYTKYIRPVGSTAPPLPYLCVPLVNSAPRVEHDGTWIKHTWTLPIMAFVGEPNVGALTAESIETLYHLGEDVYQAVMRDPTLNNTVNPVSFVSGAIEEAGISPFDGMQYADAVIPLELSIFLGLDVLGP